MGNEDKEIIKPIFEYDPNAEILELNGKQFVEITQRAIPGIMPKKFYIALDGTIYNSTTHRFSTGTVNSRGYVAIELANTENKRMSTSQHNAVTRVFDWFEGCQPLEVNHKNGVHNDNRRENLELVTHTENVHHAFRTGLNKNYGENHTYSTTTENQVNKIVDLLLTRKDLTYKEIGALCGVSEMVVVQIATKRSWNRSTNFEESVDLRRNSRFTDEQVEEMCKIFVKYKDLGFDKITHIVSEELNIPYDTNFRHKINFIYYKRNGYFTRITDKYNYL